MNLQEAIKSGKRFRRPGEVWMEINYELGMIVTEGLNSTEGGINLVEDLLAEDWEVEGETRQLSWEELEDVLLPWASYQGLVEIKKELGFK